MVEKQILIAGGGFAGVHAALNLAKKLPQASITLISDSLYHSFHADLYEIAGASLKKEGRHDFRNLRGTVSIPLKDIFANTNVTIVNKKIYAIDLKKNTVNTAKKTYTYEYLVLALGSTTNYMQVNGAEDFGHPFKTTEDALNIRNEIEELIAWREKPISLAIAGAGFTGVELAGSLSHFIKQLAKQYRRPKSTIYLIGSSAHVLEGMPDWSQKAAEKQLKKLGVKIKLQKRITLIDEKNIQTEDGDTIAYDYIIWATGIKGNNLDGGITGEASTPRGQLTPANDLRLMNYPTVFVAGDLAACMDHEHGCPVASTAWSAIDQGILVAENISRLEQGQETKSYLPKPAHFVVPIGRNFAVSDMYNTKLSGMWGYCIKRYVSLSYFMMILPPIQAIKVWWQGVRIG